MLAIHSRKNSFSDKWIEFCEKYDIQYKLVDCYSSDLIQQLNDCCGLMWHWGHHDHKAVLFARQLSLSLRAIGKDMFPSVDTAWHFDDKVGQKYLLEALASPMIPSYVFYDKSKAINWARNTSYPKVFKLRGGAGSENVRIAKTEKDALNFINRSFGRGYKVKNRRNFLKERIWRFKRDRSLSSFLNISKGIARLFIPKVAEREFPAERNYAYFQDFIPKNDHDIRVIVIGNRAFAIKRMVREGDFRASGSGIIIYDKAAIPEECLKIAFSVSKKMASQCTAFDFVFRDGEPLIVEVSYSFSARAYSDCPGYWNEKLEWIDGQFYPEFFMVEDFIKNLNLM
ncbi:ATP-grasp domain-containing protein [Idiomarina xiamenensis]|uniref:ATP-grasp fold RimK-type domain-containing protein n=1 Tax=Idiomarina xiamenensis 10-D-4 TaxID=740709 RepID=K2L624_9GAMM|nr:hypothetical protein [Idiomarina xiamenensis]EKE85200.1 hypothetical protein A10D4_02610 [Idiomarina xiamenensis 10-D-4]